MLHAVALVVALLLSVHASAKADPGDIASDFLPFGTNGKIQNLGVRFVNGIAVDQQGRIVIAASGNGAFRVQRRSGRRFATVENIDILIDPAQSRAEAQAVAIAPDGKIVITGTVVFGNTNDFAVARLNTDFTLDTTFDVDGATWVDFDGNRGDVGWAVAVQPDRKVVVVGVGSNDNGGGWGVLRFNEDGTLDNSFDGNGKKAFDTAWIAYDVAIQDDGKIVVAGGVALNRDRNDFRTAFQVVRMNSNGSLDGTFNGSGVAITEFGYSEAARALAIAPGGEIVLAGYRHNGGGNFQIARYLSNGMLDASFSGDGKLVETRSMNAEDVVVQRDGKIVVLGTYFETGVPPQMFLARYDVGGAPDPTFGFGGEVFVSFAPSAAVQGSLALQADGMLVAAATNPGDGPGLMARFRWDGSLDTGGAATLVFDPMHLGSEATAVTEADDGKLVAAGKVYRSDYDFALARISQDGVGVDTSFGTEMPRSGKIVYGLVGQSEETRDVAVQLDGEIVVAGEVGTQSQGQNFIIGRFKSDGEHDLECSFIGFTSVDYGTGDDRAHAVDIGPDNRIYAAGTVRGPAGDDFGLVRLTETCRVSTAGGGVVGPPVEYKPRRDLGGAETCVGLVRQGNRVVLAGSSGNDIALMRLNGPSSLTGIIQTDNGFGGTGRPTLDTGYREIAAAFGSQPDGKLIVAGTVDRSGTSDFLVGRFTADGQLDLDFGINGVAFADFNTVDTATSLAIRDDGTIAVAGYTSTPTGVAFAVAQLTAEGDPDTAFSGDGKATVKLGPAGEDVANAVTFFRGDRLVLGGYSVVGGLRQFALVALETTRDATVPTTTSTLAPGETTTTTSTLAPGETTTTTVETSGTTSTTTPGVRPGTPENCGNCADDDGDGLVDFEDPGCCATSGGMTVKKIGIAGGKTGTRLGLAAALAESGVASGSASTQDVTLQISGAGQPLLCAHVPAANLKRKKATLRFKDERGSVASAAGVGTLRLRGRKDGSGLFSANGRKVSLAVPPAGGFVVTLGLRDPATAESGNRCARAEVSLEATKKGALRLP